MRYRIAVLLLLAGVPAMNLLAAPAPAPSAILDIGPPPKGETLEKHSKNVIYRLTNPRGYLWNVGGDTEVCKLPSVARLKDARPWLTKNIRVMAEDGGRRLRVRFQTGKLSEQVYIINALLRYYLRDEVRSRIKLHQEVLHWEENCIVELEKRIESGQHPDWTEKYRQGINDLRANRIPACRAEIARLKQISVIKWAR